MSFSETIFLFFLALIVFGPKKLPEIARTVGKYLNEFKRASNEFRSQIEQEISQLEREKPSEIAQPTAAPAATEARNMYAGSGGPPQLAPGESSLAGPVAEGAAASDTEVPATEAAVIKDGAGETVTATESSSLGSGNSVSAAEFAARSSSSNGANGSGHASETPSSEDSSSKSASDVASDPVSTSASRESHA